MFKHVSRAGHVFACVGTYQVLSVSVCVCTCYDLRVLACIQRWLCIFVCWLVTKAGHVFSCVSHIRGLSVVCTHQKLDTDVFSLIFTHPKLSECAPACVGQYPKLGVYVDIIKLACIKRQACVCVRLHVLKLGTHLHFWGADAWLLSAVPVQPTTAAYSGTRRNMSRINALFAEAGVPCAKPYPDLEKRTRTHLDWWIYLF
jgi:hypothetical protein